MFIFYNSEQKELLALINELGLETYDQYAKGNKFWQLTDGKIKKWSGNIPPLPYTSLLDLLRFFKKVNSFFVICLNNFMNNCIVCESGIALAQTCVGSQKNILGPFQNFRNKS